MDLNEELTPREHAELRESVVTGVGRLRAARARRSRIVAGVAAAALVAVVVTAVAFTTLRQPDRVTTPIETMSPSPSPSATRAPTPEPSPSASGSMPPVASSSPSIAFDDDCAAVMSTVALSAAWGSEATAEARSYFFVDVRTAGGITCDWRFADGTTLRVSAMPSSVVDSSLRSTYESALCEPVPWLSTGCRKAVEDDKTWLLATVSGDVYQFVDGEFDEAAVRQRLDALTPLLFDALARAGAPSAATRTDEWWPQVTCDDLATKIPLAQLLGSSGYQTGFGGEASADVDSRVAGAQGFGLQCGWRPSDDSASGSSMMIMLYPGGAWDWERIATATDPVGDVVPVNVDGARAAVATRSETTSPLSNVYASDGVNVVRVFSAPDPLAAAAALLAAMKGARG
ncbi:MULTISPECIES: hypothetical protein [Microbacterium]|uniref:hypothetical protein n=1 Tax=Microbacterium TaxID=33882 RepID=UPI00077C2121|nr:MULTISPECIES: hypothetical protein [Microbacterium]QOC25974.1 hypothetical protein IC745_00660 [Microbacterium hominis]QOC29949.1 hypothetical protein IC744_06345 [Microbacterium hominis]QYF97654.1 hypothetical protein KY498_16240 [Microbacterium sp. PAMC21962]